MALFRYLVNDVEAAVAFYTNHLGFELKRQAGQDMAVVSRRDLTLLLAGPTDSAGKAMPDGRQPTAGGWNRIVIEVNNLASRMEKLKQQGVTFASDVIQGRRGRYALCQDPSGNVVELLQIG
jgi:catechol 2,3-dioxygenase-like lactoylglutathione lyase family enzyme